MRKNLLLAGVLATLATCAQAQDAPGAEHNPTGLRPFIGLGFTSGGDTLTPVIYVPEGSSIRYRESISAGGGLDLRLGLSQRLANLPLSLQVAVAFHNDQANGIDGEKLRFRRIPIEATLLWHATDRTRIGFGVRKAVNPVFKGSGITCGGNDCTGEAKLKSNVGFLLEAEYAVTPSWSLKARYVWESFKVKSVSPAWERIELVGQGEQFEANHLGVHSLWYFN
jgi:hypothetical protein